MDYQHTMNLNIKTPLWVGNIDSKTNFPKPTGIMGSLRWWTEVFIRALDKNACDPINDESCPENNNHQKNCYCYACMIFGATGLRRMFKLSAHGGKQIFGGNPINIKPAGRRHGWYLGGGLTGEIFLNIVELDPFFSPALIQAPLMVASHWGGIGARTQHGYGVVEIQDLPAISFEAFKEALSWAVSAKRLALSNVQVRKNMREILPDLREMFFAKVQFDAKNKWWKQVDGIKPERTRPDNRISTWTQSDSVPIVPALKNWLRYTDEGKKIWQFQQDNGAIENWLFGTTKNVCAFCHRNVKNNKFDKRKYWCNNCRRTLSSDKIANKISSKINISCAYRVGERWEFRIWGWIPTQFPESFNRDSFMDSLKTSLNDSSDNSIQMPFQRLLGENTSNYQLVTWREFNSPRDTVMNNQGNIERYIQSLLKGEENRDS